MSAPRRSPTKKKHFTPAEANAMLPLLRSILRDVTTLARELHDREERLQSVKDGNSGLSSAHREELLEMQAEFERGRNHMHDLLSELENLGIELKDPFVGLIDFRAQVEGREVYLCWRLDEPEVAYWHELDTGFSGRKRLMMTANSN